MAVKYAVHVCDVCGGEGHVDVLKHPVLPPETWIRVDPRRGFRDQKVVCSWDCVAALAAAQIVIRGPQRVSEEDNQ